MRGVAEGRGESAYLRSKYAEMPTFLRKVGTPSDPGGSGLCPNPPAHLKVNCPKGKRGHPGVPP